MTDKTDRYIGQGIYTVAEVSKLTGVSVANIYNWLFGGSLTKAESNLSDRKPALRHQFEVMDHIANISFKDMIQIRFASFFRAQGVSLQTIRRASDNAAKLLSTTHPFCSAKFKTDGVTLLADVMETNGESNLIELISMQQVFKEVINPFLKTLEYEENVASKWWHELGNKHVIIDPKWNFGKPTMASNGYTTETLYDAYLANGKSIKKVSNWFEVSETIVNQAIDFEMKLAA